MRNFLNANDVFPILEMIRREIKRNQFESNRNYMISEPSEFSGTSDEVRSVELFRGSNPYDPDVIDSVVTTYADGSTETITLLRGANPPVPPTVDDHEFINNVLITGFVVEFASGYGSRTVQGSLVRENGYGRIQKLELTYT
jgi:hypothetical protein